MTETYLSEIINLDIGICLHSGACLPAGRQGIWCFLRFPCHVSDFLKQH